MNIILIAPPAAGKGTQSELICNHYNLEHLSTGDLLREVTKQDNEKSREIKELMNQGALISDDIILSLIEDKMKDDKGFVFDGFPRNLNQAKSLNLLLEKLNKKIDYIIYLKVDKEIASARIAGRYVCPKCNGVYNLKDTDDKICQNCGEELIKRKDDNVEVFNNRYDVYMSETFPVINYYNSLDNFYEVDSSKKPEEVFDDIKNIIGE